MGERLEQPIEMISQNTPPESGDGEQGVDFYSNVTWQRAGAYREARMTPLVAEDLDKQVRRAVDDFRVVGEVGCRIYESTKFEALLDTVKIA